MRIESLNEDVFSVKIDNTVDIISLFLILRRYRPVIYHEILWQPKILTRGEISRGKRVRAFVKLFVEKIYLGENLDAIRITCKVIDASLPGIKGHRIGITVAKGEGLVVEINHDVLSKYAFLARENFKEFLVLVFDNRSATVARIGERIDIISSHYFSKRKIVGGEIIKHVIPILKKTLNNARSKGLNLVIAASSVYIQLIKPLARLSNVTLIEAPTSGDISGIYELLNLPEFRRIAKGIAKVEEAILIDQIKGKLIRGEIIYGLSEIEKILKDIRIHTVIFTKKTLNKLISEKLDLVERVLLSIRERGGKVLVVEDKEAIGVFINSIGGFVAF